MIMLALGGIAYADKAVTVATGDYPPTLGRNLKHYGYANHILKLAFETQGIETKFIFLPWKRAIVSTKKGGYDLTNYWFCSEKRKKDFLCGDAVFKSNFYFFHLKSTKFDWKNYNDLKKYKFGLTLGYTYTDEFVKMVNNGEIQGDWVPKDEQNLGKLLIGRIDIFPMSELEGLYLLRKSFTSEEADRITYHPKPLLIGSAHPLFPKSRSNSEKLLQLYNKGLENIISKGLQQKYNDKMIEGWYDEMIDNK